MAKDINYDVDARTSLKNGVEKLVSLHCFGSMVCDFA